MSELSRGEPETRWWLLLACGPSVPKVTGQSTSTSRGSEESTQLSRMLRTLRGTTEPSFGTYETCWLGVHVGHMETKVPKLKLAARILVLLFLTTTLLGISLLVIQGQVPTKAPKSDRDGLI